MKKKERKLPQANAVELIEIREFCRMLGIHAATYYRGVKKGTYRPPLEFGALRRIPLSDAHELIAAGIARREAKMAERTPSL